MKSLRWFGRLAALLLTTALAMAGQLALAQEPRAVLPGHVPTAVASAEKLIARKAADADAITFTVVLRRSDPIGFARLLVDLYNPGSPHFRHFPSPREVSDRFGPSVSAWTEVSSYFSAQGLRVVEESDNRMTLTLSGSMPQVEKALALQLADYRLGTKEFRAPVSDPSLPLAVAAHVDAIAGLSTLATPQRTPSSLFAGYEGLKKCVQNPGSALLCVLPYVIYTFIYDLMCIDYKIFTLGFGPCDVLPIIPPPAPDANDPRGRSEAKSLGAGQRIGIVAFDSYKQSDVADFLALVGAPASMINQVSLVPVNGGASIGADEAEVLLDINTVLMIAPNANVAVYRRRSAPAAFRRSSIA